MQRFNFLIMLTFIFIGFEANSHHYKGLPHFSYFENYPQIPYLEFIKETPEYEVFVTVYNFQGLNIDQVESPNDVRLYLFIYDISANTVFKDQARFSIFSDGRLLHDTGLNYPEQENIFVIQKSINDQSNLLLKVSFTSREGKSVQLEMPFQITKTFFQKYGLGIAVVGFFLLVAALKAFGDRLKRKQSPKGEGTVAKHA